MFGNDEETVKILLVHPETTDKLVDCPVEPGDSGSMIAYRDEPHNNDEPLPIVLDESKKRIVNDEPYYWVEARNGYVFDVSFSDPEVESGNEAQYIDAQTLRAEQMSTTIQDIADAAKKKEWIETLIPWGFGTVIVLLIFLISVVLGG